MKTAHTMPTACFTRIASPMLLVATMLGMCSANAAVLSSQPTLPRPRTITTITPNTTLTTATPRDHPHARGNAAAAKQTASADSAELAFARSRRDSSQQAKFMQQEVLNHLHVNTNIITVATFSPNNGNSNVLVVCSQHLKCIVYNAATLGDYKQVQVLRTARTVYAATFSSNGNVLCWSHVRASRASCTILRQ